MGTNRISAIWEWVSPDRGRIAVYALVSVLALAAVLSVGAHLILAQERGHQEGSHQEGDHQEGDHQEGDHQEEGIIDAISPQCASVGAQVTITGRALGGRNVRIVVGGVPAEVVNATGTTATFVVPAGVHLGPARVTATNPGGHKGSIAFWVCDLLVPESWGGEWTITLTYQKTTPGSVAVTRETTAPIRTNEPFGLSSVAYVGGCAGSVSDEHLAVQCLGKITNGTCILGTSVKLAVDRSGNSISGTGTWVTTVAGQCGPFGNANRTIQISGQRLSLFQNPSGPPISLVRSFAPFGSLIDSAQ
jgi:hypothetical protein